MHARNDAINPLSRHLVVARSVTVTFSPEAKDALDARLREMLPNGLTDDSSSRPIWIDVFAS